MKKAIKKKKPDTLPFVYRQSHVLDRLFPSVGELFEARAVLERFVVRAPQRRESDGVDDRFREILPRSVVTASHCESRSKTICYLFFIRYPVVTSGNPSDRASFLNILYVKNSSLPASFLSTVSRTFPHYRIEFQRFNVIFFFFNFYGRDVLYE